MKCIKLFLTLLLLSFLLTAGASATNDYTIVEPATSEGVFYFDHIDEAINWNIVSVSTRNADYGVLTNYKNNKAVLSNGVYSNAFQGISADLETSQGVHAYKQVVTLNKVQLPSSYEYFTINERYGTTKGSNNYYIDVDSGMKTQWIDKINKDVTTDKLFFGKNDLRFDTPFAYDNFNRFIEGYYKIKYNSDGNIEIQTIFAKSDIDGLGDIIHFDPSIRVWTRNTTLTEGLGDIGAHSSPALFVRGGNLHLITGEGDETNGATMFYGFTWNGSGWDSNASLVSGLPVVVSATAFDSPSPQVFDDGLKIVFGTRNFITYNFKAYDWDGTTWIENSTQAAGLYTIYAYSTVELFDNATKAITVDVGAELIGFTWNGSGWDVNSTIIAGVTNDFYSFGTFDDGSINGVFAHWDNTFDGKTWNGSGWDTNQDIVSQLPEIEDFSKEPSIVAYNGAWYGLFGKWDGTFYGFNYAFPSLVTSNDTMTQTVSTTRSTTLTAIGEFVTSWIWKIDGVDQNNNATTFLNTYPSINSTFTDGFETGTIDTGVWTMIGDTSPAWAIDSNKSNNGAYSIKSGVVSNYDTVTMSRDVGVGPNAYLTYSSTMVESKNTPIFIVKVDGVAVEYFDNAYGWTDSNISLSAGNHTIEFTYSHTATIDYENDAVHIDDISISGIVHNVVRVTGSSPTGDATLTYALTPNTAPTVASAGISPAIVGASDDMTATNGTTSDAEGDTVSFWYRWYKNDILQTGLNNMSVVGSSNTTTGEIWKLGLIPVDAYNNGTEVLSATVTIGSGNAPPTLTGIVANASIKFNNSITITTIGANDINSETYSLNIGTTAGASDLCVGAFMSNSSQATCSFLVPFTSGANAIYGFLDDGTDISIVYPGIVTVDTTPPVIGSTSLSVGSVGAGSDLTISASVTVANGEISTVYAVINGVNYAMSGSNGTYSYIFNTQAGGEYSVTYTATDDSGNIGYKLTPDAFQIIPSEGQGSGGGTTVINETILGDLLITPIERTPYFFYTGFGEEQIAEYTFDTNRVIVSCKLEPAVDAWCELSQEFGDVVSVFARFNGTQAYYDGAMTVVDEVGYVQTAKITIRVKNVFASKMFETPIQVGAELAEMLNPIAPSDGEGNLTGFRLWFLFAALAVCLWIIFTVMRRS